MVQREVVGVGTRPAVEMTWRTAGATLWFFSVPSFASSDSARGAPWTAVVRRPCLSPRSSGGLVDGLMVWSARWMQLATD
jgi:hypothetical protein